MKRWEALDEFRGFAVVLLILLSPFVMFSEVPIFLKHAEGNGFMLADLGAPLFLFAVGISNRLSFLSRLNAGGKWQAIRHCLSRSLIFIALGLIGELFKYKEWRFHWGVLEMIGLSSLIALPFMFLDFKKRLLVGSVLVLFWQLLLSNGYNPVALQYDMGGPLGSLAWSSILLLASGLADVRKNAHDVLASMVLIFFFASILGHRYWPINKQFVTLPYIALSISMCSSFFLLFSVKEDLFKIPLLAYFGRNALLFYVWSGFTALAVEYIFPPAIGWNYILAVIFGIFIFDSALAKFLDVRKIYWKI